MPDVSFGRFLTKIIDYGLEYFELYYGVYRANVEDNDDPEGQGRVKVRVPAVNIEGNPPLPAWAYPFISGHPSGEDKGDYNVPDEGDYVWVMFEGGDINSPIYASGGWFGTGEKPDEFETVDDRGTKTSSGHIFRFRDLDGEESILLKHSSGSCLEMMENGSVELLSNSGDSITLDSQGDISVNHRNGSSVDLGSSGNNVDIDTSTGTSVNLSGTSINISSAASVTLDCARAVIDGSTSVELGSPASHPLLKGDVFIGWLGGFIAWAAAHVHVGPFTPPVAPPPPPPMPSFLSVLSRTK